MLEDQEKTLKELMEGKKVKKKEDDVDIDMKFLNGEDGDDLDVDVALSDDDVE
jgi:hypothetical protein